MPGGGWRSSDVVDCDCEEPAASSFLAMAMAAALVGNFGFAVAFCVFEDVVGGFGCFVDDVGNNFGLIGFGTLLVGSPPALLVLPLLLSPWIFLAPPPVDVEEAFVLSPEADLLGGWSSVVDVFLDDADGCFGVAAAFRLVAAEDEEEDGGGGGFDCCAGWNAAAAATAGLTFPAPWLFGRIDVAAGGGGAAGAAGVGALEPPVLSMGFVIT